MLQSILSIIHRILLLQVLINMGRKTLINKTGDQNQSFYEVEAICGMKTQEDGGIFYLVKWKGYTTKESTWEPIQNLKTVRSFVQKYNRSLIKAIENKKKKKKVIKQFPQNQKIKQFLTSSTLQAKVQGETLIRSKSASNLLSPLSQTQGVVTEQITQLIDTKQLSRSKESILQKIVKVQYFTQSYELCVLFSSGQKGFVTTEQIKKNNKDVYMQFLQSRVLFQ